MSSIFGANIDLIESSMRFRVARQAVLSSNVTNADTPAYRRFELTFDELLEDNPRQLSGSDPRHLRTQGPSGSDYQLERGKFGNRPDRNGVDLDHELLQLSRNASVFTQQAEVLSRLLALRRIAVTGEPR